MQAFLVMDSGVFRSETNVRLQTYRASDFHNEDVVAAMRAGSREHQKNYTLVGAVSVQIVTNYTSPQWRWGPVAAILGAQHVALWRSVHKRLPHLPTQPAQAAWPPE